MDIVPQGQKRVQPSLFNKFKPKNKKNRLSLSNIESNTSYNIEKRSNTKYCWSNLKLDASYKIKNSINNKTSRCNLKSESSYNIEWLKKKNIVDDIENDGRFALCNKYRFKDQVSFLNHICQKAEQNSLIHYGLMQFRNNLYPKEVKPPKPKKKVSEIKKQFANDRICYIIISN